jgi:hypothetical protein
VKYTFVKEEDYNGYIPLFSRMIQPPISNFGETTGEIVKKTESCAEYLQMLHEMIVDSEQLGIHLVLVASPMFNGSVASDEIQEPNIISRVTFLDYSTDTDFAGHLELFSDAEHLNDAGADIFSHKLVEKLRDMTME